MYRIVCKTIDYVSNDFINRASPHYSGQNRRVLLSSRSGNTCRYVMLTESVLVVLGGWVKMHSEPLFLLPGVVLITLSLCHIDLTDSPPINTVAIHDRINIWITRTMGVHGGRS